jgi:hypothetical protein
MFMSEDLDSCLLQVAADQEAAEKVKVTLAAEERDVKKLQAETMAIAADAKVSCKC